MSSTTTPLNDAYWSTFQVREDDLDFIFNLLLEEEKPLTTAEMMVPLVSQRLAELEREATAAAESQIPVYRPINSYEIGQELVFPALDGMVGKVVAIRPGENPDLDEFEVLEVEVENGDGHRSFASQLSDHKLNQVEEQTDQEAKEDPVAVIMGGHGKQIEASLVTLLQDNEDIVRIAYRWFPRSLLARITDGHLNLAEAVLDVAKGGPLPTDEIREHIELPADLDPLLAQFSLDYALQEDERFDEVGPAGEILWHLKRLEPAEVLGPPSRLEYEERSYNRDLLTDDLLGLEGGLEDEFNPPIPIEDPIKVVALPLLFPHWRTGALPLSPRLRELFPTAYEAPRIRFILRDGHSNETFPGWVVRKQGYVFGLEDFYRMYEIPPGGLIRIRLSEKEGEVIVEAVERRKRSDWIRTVAINEGGGIGFTMLKQPTGADYDEHMVVGLVDADALDEAWNSGTQRRMTDEKLIAYVFRELARLNPQSAVHAKSLYSGVNVLRRLPPGPIFAELVTRDYYEHVGDLYWRIEDGPGIGDN
jgi:hypothetical protein